MKSVLSIVFFCLPGMLALSQNNLDHYVAEAKKNSPLIKDFTNQGKASQLEADRLKVVYTKPQIGLTANYLFAPIINLDSGSPKFEANTSGASEYRGYDLAVSNSGQYQALMTITQPLFNKGKLDAAKEQMEVATRVSQNNAKLSAHDLEKVVADQYILCAQDHKLMEYSDAMLKLLAEQKVIVEKLVSSSIYKQSDLALLSLETENFKLQLTNYNATYRRDLLDLNILCGINDTSFVNIQALNLDLMAPVQNSQYEEKYKLDSLNLVAAKHAFELKYRPQLSVFGNAGLNAVYAPTIPKRFGANAGISFSYTVFDGRQKSINRSKTDVLINSVTAYHENFSLQNDLRKTRILNEIQSYTPRMQISEQQLADYHTLLGLYRKEILTGQLSIINYITTLKNMATMQRDNALLASQKQLLINAYNYWNW